jgi:hypothetical protein
MAGYGEQYGVGQYGLESSSRAPVLLQNQSPADGAVDVTPYTKIYLELTDADGDLAEATVLLKINGVTAWSGDAEQPGFSVTKTAITNGFSYLISPSKPLERGSQAIVDVYAEDGIANILRGHWHFTVGVGEWLLKRDHFDNETVDADAYAGNGIITEPAGSDLKLDCPNSANCDWYSSINNAPRASYAMADVVGTKPRRTGLFVLECRMTDWAATAANVAGGLCVFDDYQNAYQAFFYEPTDDYRVDRLLANVGANLYQGGDGQPHPSSNVWKFAIVWNDSDYTRRARLSGFGYTTADYTDIPGRQIRFYVSVNDGTSWTLMHTRTIDTGLDLNHVGVYQKKWDAGASANSQAYFDYLELWELEPPEQVYEQKEPGDAFGDVEGSQSITPKASIEDASTVSSDAEGPLAHGPQVPMGVRLPGPAGQQPGTVGPFDAAGIEDESTPLQDLALTGQPLGIGQQAQDDVQLGRATAGLEDVSEYFASIATDYRTDTTDGEGHAHFIGERVVYAFVYEAANEGALWTTPTDPAFTGYGQDGYEYIAGVQQPAGPHAPWATEGAGTDRSSRVDFPDKVLICVTFSGHSLTPAEVVIFDLDGYPTNLNVWMRFRFGTSGGNYTMLGRVNQKPTKVRMAGGVMVVCTEEGDYRGGLHIVNFKASGQDCAHHIRSDNHFKWVPGNGIADRNLTGASQWTTTGVSPSLRIESEEVWDISMHADADDVWVAVGGEDPGPNLLRIQDVPNWMIDTTGDVGEANIGDKRNMIFDENGWLFLSIDNQVYRVIPQDYEEGLIHLDSTDRFKRIGSESVTARMPTTIKQMESEGRYIYLALESGIYMMHVATMDFWLAYTAPGDGGKGRDNGSPGAGELLAGGDSDIKSMAITRRYMTELSTWMHYLTVATRSGATVIRLWDEVVVDSRTFDDLHEPGAWFNVSKAE